MEYFAGSVRVDWSDSGAAGATGQYECICKIVKLLKLKS